MSNEDGNSLNIDNLIVFNCKDIKMINRHCHSPWTALVYTNEAGSAVDGATYPG